MKFDYIEEDDEWGEGQFQVDNIQGCCQVYIAYDHPTMEYGRIKENILWEWLCEVLSSAKDYRNGVFLILHKKKQEQLCDALECTPYATILAEYADQHGVKGALRFYNVKVNDENNS